MRLNRTTLIFLVIGCTIILTIGFFLQNSTTQAPSPPIGAVEAGGRLFEQIRFGDVVGWTVRDEQAERDNRFVQGADGWLVVETILPGGAGLSQNAISDALSTLINATSSASFVSDDLAPFSLDTPHYTITMTLEDGTDYALQIGTLNPANTRYYGRIIAPSAPSNLVYLINNPTQIRGVLTLANDLPLLLPPTTAPEPALRVPGVVFTSYRAQDVVQMVWRGQDVELLIEPDSEDGWRVNDETGDTQRIDLLLRAWGGLRATDAISAPDDALFALGLDDSAYELHVTTVSAVGVERDYLLRIGTRDASGTRYYTLSSASDDVLLMPVEDVEVLLSALTNPPLMINTIE